MVILTFLMVASNTQLHSYFGFFCKLKGRILIVMIGLIKEIMVVEKITGNGSRHRKDGEEIQPISSTVAIRSDLQQLHSKLLWHVGLIKDVGGGDNTTSLYRRSEELKPSLGLVRMCWFLWLHWIDKGIIPVCCGDRVRVEISVRWVTRTLTWNKKKSDVHEQRAKGLLLSIDFKWQIHKIKCSAHLFRFWTSPGEKFLAMIFGVQVHRERNETFGGKRREEN